MANIKSAKKRAQQAIVRRQHNMTIRSKYRTILKKATNATTEDQLDKAQELLKTVQSEGHKAARKNILPTNKVSRDIRKLNAKIKAKTLASNS